MRKHNLKQLLGGVLFYVLGRVLRAVGRMFRSPRLRAAGVTEEARGRAKVGAANSMERVERGVGRAAADVQRKLTDILARH